MGEEDRQENSELDGWAAKRLSDLDFDRGYPVYVVQACDALEQIKRSLFDSTFVKPEVVTVDCDPDDEANDPPWHIYFLVELVQVLYLPGNAPTESGIDPVGAFVENPDFYVRGRLYQHPFVPRSRAATVHLFAEAIAGGDLLLQVVPRPSDADDSVPFRYGKGAPHRYLMS
jgi:hypothetical protein